ncbi:MULTISPECIES: HTR-like protein [unclassified Haladaptatus]|uniref:RAD55 family ATPase n=1 Tax=unclassified Haladaptatus TaxID=2622732 RepID=UPI0023E7D68B|nr:MULTISPECIES: HTR-like protein [unclassified Haladaptatus]
MKRIPFGIPRLDTIINGGAPAGSVVLLSGEAGAGAREFMYTSAVMNALAHGDPDQFELYYGDLQAEAASPAEVHYLSFTADEAQLTREIGLTIDEEIVNGSVDAITFHDLSDEYFNESQVPREWYAEQALTIDDLGASHDTEGVLTALSNCLDQVATGNLVVIDSLTDLVNVVTEERPWADVTLILKGLQKAAYRWQGLILLSINPQTIDSQSHEQLVEATDGTMEFTWETGGSSRARTMFVKQFRGVLPRIEAEDIVRFETDIGDAGFDISDVRKIR